MKKILHSRIAASETAEEHARRLGALAYAALMFGLIAYIATIWVQVFIDTRKTRAVSPDLFFESHRHWRMRTTLIFLIWTILGGLSLPFGFGWFIVIPAYVWFLYRIVKGVACFHLGWPVGIGAQLAHPRTRG